jgi:hypothetical protein
MYVVGRPSSACSCSEHDISGASDMKKYGRAEIYIYIYIYMMMSIRGISAHSSKQAATGQSDRCSSLGTHVHQLACAWSGRFLRYHVMQLLSM